jgi:ribonuclease P protein component
MASRRRAGNGHGRPQRRRLSRSAEFERVYRQGRSKGNRFFVLYAFPRDDPGRSGAPGAPVASDTPGGESAHTADQGPRLGLSVSRRVGGAVERSRVKRVLREAFWAEAERLPDGSDYVVVARPEAGPLAERDGLAGVQTALAELVDAIGGRESEASARSEP